jgi:pimeloyl-ACP methyl ester carboxylesterase
MLLHKQHLVAALCASLAMACGQSGIDFPDDDGGGVGGSGGEVETTEVDPLPDPPQLTFDWFACPWETYGSSALDAECADVDVPLDWWDPDGAQIQLYLKRGGDITNPNAQQLWFLMGGPGGASNGYEGLGRGVFEAVPETVVYLLDHRGVGRSTRLGCAAESANTLDGVSITFEEVPDCIAENQAIWGEGLQHFSTTAAALDLGTLIAQTRIGQQRVHVHGGSYGTYWAQRYLQFFPDQATAVSMLGVVNPTEFSFTRYDEQYEAQGAAYLDACASDSVCSSKLGADPAATLRSVMDNIGGLCPGAIAAGLDRDTLRTYAGSFLLVSWEERVLPLALVYRIQRCDPEDVLAIETFINNVPPPINGLLDNPLYSRVLGMHVSMSELWYEPHISAQQADAYAADALFAFGSIGRRFELDGLWPTYDPQGFNKSFAKSSIPILMIEGELDPASTHAQAVGVGENFSGPQQHFVTIPNGSHSFKSPTTSGAECATSMFVNFVFDPYAPLVPCVDDIVDLRFDGTMQLASLMGSLDIWENESGNSNAAAAIEADPATQERASAALRQKR